MATEKILNTRIQLRYDTYTNWYNNNPALKRGEVAIATIPQDHTDPSTGKVTQIPAVVMKVGTGAETGSNYRDLPFVSALAADVLEACKTEAGLTAFVANVIKGADLDTNTDFSNLVDTVNTLKGEGTGSVAKQIEAAIAALKLDETYVAQETGKSLMADAEHTKLAGISTGANKVEASTTNGKIKIDGVETTVYTHPEQHTASEISDFATEVAKVKVSNAGNADTATKATQDASGNVITATYATKGELTEHANAAAGLYETQDHAASKLAEAKKYTDDEIEALGLGTMSKETATDYVKKSDAEGYDDILTKTVAATMYAKADEFGSYKGLVNTIIGSDASKSMRTVAGEEAADALAEAKQYTDDEIAKIPAQTDYSVTIEEDTSDTTVAKTYTFTQCGQEIGSIKLAKELVVTSGSVKEVTTAGQPYSGAAVGDKYIELVIANQATPIYVPAKDLVDIYTAKSGATEVQVAISNTNEVSATIVNGGVTEAKLHADVAAKLNKKWEEVGVAQGLVDGLAQTHATDKAALEKAISDGDAAVEGKVTALGNTVASTYATKQELTDHANAATGLYETKDNAASKLAEAKKYTDDEIEELALGTMSKEAAADYIKKAEIDNFAVTTVVTGSDDGTIAVDGKDVAVKGLGSAAYTASTAYATAAQGTKADTAVQPGDLGTMAKEAATDYVKKDDAEGYGDILTKTAAKAEYATLTGLAGVASTAGTAVQSVTCAANSGLKATRTQSSVTIDWDDAVTLIFDCGDSTN